MLTPNQLHVLSILDLQYTIKPKLYPSPDYWPLLDDLAAYSYLSESELYKITKELITLNLLIYDSTTTNRPWYRKVLLI